MTVMRKSKDKKTTKWAGRLVVCLAAPAIWQREEENKAPERLSLLALAAVAPCGSWRLWGRAAYSPCSPRQNAAQEDRKEAGLFFMDALCVCLTAGLKQSNSSARQRHRDFRAVTEAAYL